MREVTLKSKQVNLVKAALEVAAEQYRKDAKASREAKHARVARDFEKQAKEALELAELFGDEPDEVKLIYGE